jgi:ABC-type multidrug transport system fused ATPase/permease subunit
VIRGISFDVKAQEKVGIVGRTGSGKSTLALSFFRFVEASAGSICIDGIDIHDIGTKDLRSNLTIIPQGKTFTQDKIKKREREEGRDLLFVLTHYYYF